MLGKFKGQQTQSFLPGNYIIRGRRKGYQEVISEVRVRSGRLLPTINVVCSDRFGAETVQLSDIKTRTFSMRKSNATSAASSLFSAWEREVMMKKINASTARITNINNTKLIIHRNTLILRELAPLALLSIRNRMGI